MNYEDVFTINEFVKGATIHHSIGVHTINLCITQDIPHFKKIYYNMRAYLRSRSSEPGFTYIYSLYDSCSDKLISEKIIPVISLPYVRITNGIAVRMYTYYNANKSLVCQVKVIINPILFTASFNADFDPKLYDYTFITIRSDEFWKSFGPKITNLLEKWDILNDNEYFSIMLARIDFCVDVSVPEEFPIATYVKYMHRVLKRYSYSDEVFYDKDFYAHQITTRNKSQAFSIYDKIYEQKINYNNRIEKLHLVRLRYVLRHVKIREILQNIFDGLAVDVYESVTENKSFDQIIGIIRYLITISPVVFIYGINLVFPRGSIISSLMAKRRVRLFIRNKKTKHALYKILNNFSKLKNYTDVVDMSYRMKKSFGQLRYYRYMNKLREIGLAPMYLDKEDVEAGITSFPCVYDLFISAITNTEEEYRYLLNYIDE